MSFLHKDKDGKMPMWVALVEWESGGLSEIPTENLVELLNELKKELDTRHSDKSLEIDDK
jgi:hypothetical protein